MSNVVCKSCGGTVVRKGNYYVCDFCRSKWMIDEADDINAVARANAWEALRQNDFEKAIELFDEIILKDKDNHEAYWGRALSANGIVYVIDYNEKKVPTCNNITENSFLENKDVKKAIDLAPSDIANGYREQADAIEKIRIEWLEKARKEPAYDVFISFKDSDKENGIVRTQDSVDAQDLYNALVDEGYKVFFSRVSLRSKVSEQYEPYIYNAIKTAKVMIVYGEKSEYFTSAWIKNEWGRFKKRIEEGDKHKNSLVVVYKNMDPSDLPSVLKSRQCLNANEITFLPVLINHIKRIIAETAKVATLEKIEVKGGQISKKSSSIKQETLKTREITSGLSVETSVSERQSLDLVKWYLSEGNYTDAKGLLNDIMLENPNLPEALLYQLLIEHQKKDEIDLLQNIVNFSKNDFKVLTKVIDSIEKEHAEAILDALYNVEIKNSSLKRAISDDDYYKILNIVLPYEYKNRAANIKKAFTKTISKKFEKSFFLLLSTLQSGDVDNYIKYNLKFAKAVKAPASKRVCCNNVLSVEEGNVEALKILLDVYLEIDDVQNTKKTVETILKFTNDQKETIVEIFKQIRQAINSKEDCVVFNEILKYYPDDIAEIKELLFDVVFTMIGQGCYKEADYLLSLIADKYANNPQIYWAICLIKTKSKNENAIVESDVFLKSLPEYTKYLSLVDNARRSECVKITKGQEEREEKRKRVEEEKRNREKRAIAYEQYLDRYPLKRREKEIIEKRPKESDLSDLKLKLKPLFITWIVFCIIFLVSGIACDDFEYSAFCFLMSGGIGALAGASFWGYRKDSKSLDEAEKEYQELQKIPPFKEEDYE